MTDPDKATLIKEFATIQAKLSEHQQAHFDRAQQQLNKTFANALIETSDEEKLLANIAIAQTIIDESEANRRKEASLTIPFL